MSGSVSSGITSAIERGGRSGALRVYRSLDELPALAAALFERADGDLFASRPWYETLVSAGLPSDAQPLFAVCGDDHAPFALLPLASGAARGRLGSLTGLYTCAFRPLFRAPDAGRAGRLIGDFVRRAALTRLDAIQPETPGLVDFVAGLRAAGLVVWRFDAFGNWYEPVGGCSFASYLAARPGALRATIRRKARRLDDRLEFSVVTGEEGLAQGIADYEAVYARSWKVPEPFPNFNPALMRTAAALGLLRLGVLRVSGKPAALQFWVISGGRAMVLKLAHDDAFARFSPGTVLTALMIERLLTERGVTELDFGRGDDPYKQLWVTKRRQRIGLMIANPRRLGGLVEIARSGAGFARRELRTLLARSFHRR